MGGPTPPRRLGRLAARSSLALVSLVLALVALELGLRLAGAGIAPRGDALRAQTSRPVPAEEIPGVHRLLVPGAEARLVLPGKPGEPEREVLYRINAQGFRGPEVTPERRPGVARVAVLGDSFTYGTAIDYPETFPAQMQALWAQRRPEQPVEVLNWGIYAFNAGQIAHLLAHWAPRFRPDLALIVLYINDASGPGIPPDPERVPDRRVTWIQRLGLTSGIWGPNDPKTPAQARTMWLRERSRLADLACHRLYQRWVGRLTRANYLCDWSEGSPGRESVRHALALAARLARQHGFELHVAMYPDLTSLAGGYPFAEVHALLAELCAELGIAYHELLPLFEGFDPRQLVAHDHDHHPNGTANRIVAEHLLEALDFAGLPR